MEKIIIGIHGLANKPSKAELTQAWQTAIAEGLQKNEGYDSDFDFRMVYWADYLYKHPLHNDTRFEFDGLFNDEPYYQARAEDLVEYKDRLLDDIRAGVLDLAGVGLDALKGHFGFNTLADIFLSKFLKDLAYYYDERQILEPRDGGPPQAARQILQFDLINEILAASDKQIMLIAHSMGSIIAYDVIRDLGPGVTNEHGDLSVDHFVTIGSPLGLPHVQAKIKTERNYHHDEKRSVKDDVRTPSIVSRSWINFADKKDPVSLDVQLADDYGPNRAGVRAVDDLVANDYQRPIVRVTADGQLDISHNPNGRKNYHKSYGYLRAPEVSAHIRRFLEAGD
ncbi:MAG: esterase/lipase family protein [Gammaproteobacteria bacterium]